jgi:biotin carboxyl carrier protein
MTFDIEVNGQSRSVVVEAVGGDRYRVVVEGKPREIDVARAGTYGLSLLFAGDDGLSREVQVTPSGERGELLVRLDGRTAIARLGRGRGTGGAADAGTSGGRAGVVAAPMPGRVVRVLVAPGDQVSRRQPVVVVEAMKMENELRSPKDGRVTDIAVAPGESVEAGRTLVVIE